VIFYFAGEYLPPLRWARVRKVGRGAGPSPCSVFRQEVLDVAQVHLVDIISSAEIASDAIDVIGLLDNHHFGSLLDLVDGIISISSSFGSEFIQAVYSQLLHFVSRYQPLAFSSSLRSLSLCSCCLIGCACSCSRLFSNIGFHFRL
jgi:hypothetical protein